MPFFPFQLFQCRRFRLVGIMTATLQIVTAVMILEKQKTLQIQSAKQLKVKKRFNQDTLIFAIGSVSYSLIEIIWRGYTHWTMMITGGVCFLVLFRVFNRIAHTKLWKKCAVGACVITGIEFTVGCIVNLWLQMNVWDYSFLPLNLMGQICPLYTFLWGLLSIPIVYLSGKIKQKLFD